MPCSCRCSALQCGADYYADASGCVRAQNKRVLSQLADNLKHSGRHVNVSMKALYAALTTYYSTVRTRILAYRKVSAVSMQDWAKKGVTQRLTGRRDRVSSGSSMHMPRVRMLCKSRIVTVQLL